MFDPERGMERWVCRDLPQLEGIAEQILRYGEGETIWLFRGDMGAGKTTLIRELGKLLKIESHISSPTFSIVNEYETTGGEPVYHFDFYRLKNEAEAVDIGTGEYLYSGNLCLIEWPANIAGLIPDKYLMVDIEIGENNTRIFSLSKNE